MRRVITTSCEVRQILRDIRHADPSLHHETVLALRSLLPHSGEPVDVWGDMRRMVRADAMAEFFVMPGGQEIHVVRLVCAT